MGLLVSLEANLKTTTIGILHYPAPNYFFGDNVLCKFNASGQFPIRTFLKVNLTLLKVVSHKIIRTIATLRVKIGP